MTNKNIPTLEGPAPAGATGEVRVRFDLRTSMVNVEAAGLALPTVLQVLIQAAAGVANHWAQIDSRLIRVPAEGGDDATEESDDNSGG